MKFIDDKQLLYHVQLPVIFSAIIGLLIHWNIFQVLSLGVSSILLMHWLSSHFNGNTYDIFNNRLFGLTMLCVFALFYVLGFYVIEGKINNAAFMDDESGTKIAPILGSIHPRMISMIIVLLPLGPYILHMAYGCVVNDKEHRA